MQPFQRRMGGPGVCGAVGRSFAVAMLLAVPAGYLAVFELAEDNVGGDLGLVLLFVVPLLLLPFALGARLWAARWREALRWCGRAAVRYLARYLVPMALVAPFLVLLLRSALGAEFGGAAGFLREEFPALVAVTAVAVGVPMVVALLVVAPWAVLPGRPAPGGARLVLAVLPNALPVLLLLMGGVPAVLIVVANLVFSCRVLPGAPPGARGASKKV